MPSLLAVWATPMGSVAPAEVVLLSDGKNTTGATDPIGVAQTAKRLGIRINTVALGTPTGTVQVQDNLGFTQTIQVPPDRPTLRQIAQTTGGRFFTAADAAALRAACAAIDALEVTAFAEPRVLVREWFALSLGLGLLLATLGHLFGRTWLGVVP